MIIFVSHFGGYLVLTFATQVFVYRQCFAEDALNSAMRVEEVSRKDRAELRMYRNVDRPGDVRQPAGLGGQKQCS